MASESSAITQPRKTNIFLNISFIFLFFFYIVTSDGSNEPETTAVHTVVHQALIKRSGCDGVYDYRDCKSKCMYVKSHIGCRSKGYINYLQIFYCTCDKVPFLGPVILLLWLLVLFYLLGNTAADYFCPSLENLSKILKLSPTIAGVTLLSLGNGAPDVFASVVSFTRYSKGDVGLNSILGAAFFVSSAVVGVISTLISSKEISVDKSSFIRDVCFFLLSLSSLLLIIIAGKVNLWSSIAFLSIYFFYVFAVCIMHIKSKKVKNCSVVSQEDLVENIPLLGYVGDQKPISEDKTTLEDGQEKTSFLFCNLDSSITHYLDRVWYVLELPLYLPRRLTIPVVNAERWSKLYAVASVTLAPLLLAAALCNTQSEKKLGSSGSLVTYMVAGLVGVVLGNLAYVTTKKSCPPEKCLFPWFAGGFFMSVTWTYIIAQELVSFLVSLGYILGISASFLGFTVIAWGNSLGDLIANSAVAVNGGTDGAQIAISGCYAGPMFNTLLGLGISFAITSWSKYPSYYVIPIDPYLYETLAFLIGGLLWALVILPRNNMRLDRFLGFGLLAIYSCFLSLRLAGALGILNLHGVSLFKA